MTLTLFDEDDATPLSFNREGFDRAVIDDLDDRSSIIIVRQFVLGHQSFLEELIALDGWVQRQRWMYNRLVNEPRLTLEYQDIDLAPSNLVALAAILGEYCGVRYDSIWMNWYRDNQDGTGWHRDRPANRLETATVPVVSLGESRRFLVRPAGGGPSRAYTVSGGDLLIMKGRCQKDWEHSVPKERSRSGPRVSLNFMSTELIDKLEK